MTPVAKFMRTILLLPVREAEERERKVSETSETLKRARQENMRMRDLVNQSAENLHRTYDQLLERTKWGN